MPRKTDKRVRLVEAAKILIHQQGFSLTTLADIAQHADVPLGNVYYYFKTKEAIGDAVIDKRMTEWKDTLVHLMHFPTPLERLEKFVESNHEDLELIARFGCAVGGLCQELGKQNSSTLSHRAAKLLHDMIIWVEMQFRGLGFAAAHAQSWAYSLVSFIQGTNLLTHTFKDPIIAERQSVWIKTWLKDSAQKSDQYANSSESVRLPAGLSEEYLEKTRMANMGASKSSVGMSDRQYAIDPAPHHKKDSETANHSVNAAYASAMKQHEHLTTKVVNEQIEEEEFA